MNLRASVHDSRLRTAHLDIDVNGVRLALEIVQWGDSEATVQLRVPVSTLQRCSWSEIAAAAQAACERFGVLQPPDPPVVLAEPTELLPTPPPAAAPSLDCEACPWCGRTIVAKVHTAPPCMGWATRQAR